MNWINILSALLTPAIGATTAYVAWQQWQSARLKLRLDLYDRRARIYGEVCTFLSAVLSNATISVSDVRQLRSGTAEVEFLFEPDIAQYIDLVMKHAMALAAATLKYDANLKLASPVEGHQQTIEEMHAEIQWFDGQHKLAQAKFGRYLRLT